MAHGPDKTIYLHRSRYSKAFEPEESLWEDEIERMMALIRSHSSALFESGNRRDSHREESGFIAHDSKDPLLSIGIFGTYGSGKSSLLRTFRERINEASKPETERSGHAYLNAVALPVLEPNRLHRDDHFLYAFLAEVLEEDRKQQEKHFGKNGRDTQILTNIQQSFQEVSEYLQAVDEKPGGQEGDALGLSLERLDRHHSALQLRMALRNFIDIMANELGNGTQSLIILPVDDADMDLEHLRSTLTSIRRYLLHPRLVPVLTFTGRLAEEHLRADYEQRMTFSSDRNEAAKLKEASTELTIAEQLVLQYLHKVIPVRNRIRQGAAVSLLQRARYVDQTGDIETEAEGDSVFDLLEKGSRLLFGQPQWLVQPSIRSPLRSSTLRRQIQILDALHAANVHLFLGGGNNELKRFEKLKRPLSWGEIFEKATWSLLNVHRDVLKEYHLNLDDLYSWTPDGLQKVILRSIGKKPKERRRELIRDWRHRSENRRAMMLSLLAANVFRPRMGYERPRGDNPRTVKSWPIALIDDPKAKPTGSYDHKDYKAWASFPVEKGVIWFCNLWIGFYLPQILSFRQTELDHHHLRKNEGEPGKDAGNGFDWNGWSLKSGPVNAIRSALDSGELNSTGMMFLDCGEFAKQVMRRVEENRELTLPRKSKSKAGQQSTQADELAEKMAWKGLLMQIWSVYGNETEGVWSAVSFWRGLSLMAQLLGMHMEFRESKRFILAQLINKPPEKVTDEEMKLEENQEKLSQNMATRVRYLVYQHLKTARVLSLPMGIKRFQRIPINERFQCLIEPILEADPKYPFAFWRFSNFDMALNSLVTKLVEWLDSHDRRGERIRPMKPVEEEEIYTQGREVDRYKKRLEWKSDFVRRLHADNLLAIFWQELDHPHQKELTESWTAADALRKWVRVLKRYWDCGKGYHETESPQFIGRNLTQSIMLDCPFVQPFTTACFMEIQDIFINNQIMSNVFIKDSVLSDEEARGIWETWNTPFRKSIMAVEKALEHFSNKGGTIDRTFEEKEVECQLEFCKENLDNLTMNVSNRLGDSKNKTTKVLDRDRLRKMEEWWKKKLNRTLFSKKKEKFKMWSESEEPSVDEALQFIVEAMNLHLKIIQKSFRADLDPAEFFNIGQAKIHLHPIKTPSESTGEGHNKESWQE